MVFSLPIMMIMEMKFNKASWNSHVWEYPERDFLIYRHWTLCGGKKYFYLCYESLDALNKGINLASFDSLKEAKEFFKNVVDSNPNTL